MANLRVPYETTGNAVGTIISEAVSLTRQAHDAMARANAILLAIGADTDVETVLEMPPNLSYGAAMLAIIAAAKSGLDTIAADMGRLGQG